jgi:hypothetical protein
MRVKVVALEVRDGRWHSEAPSVRFGCHSVACQLERSATQTPSKLRFNFFEHGQQSIYSKATVTQVPSQLETLGSNQTSGHTALGKINAVSFVFNGMTLRVSLCDNFFY